MKTPLRHQAYEIIKKKIITLELKPGDSISEAGLKEEFSLGRTPVREALLMLEQERLVECRRNIGYQVRKLSISEASDFFALRKCLELFSAPLIIERITPQQISEAERILDRAAVSTKASDVMGIAKCNSDFHRLLYEATASEAFIESLSSLMSKINWLIAIAIQGGSVDALADHHRILAAIKRKDLSGLEKEMTYHLEQASSRYRAAAELFCKSE